MSASGFNDAQKLADALALARSFKKKEANEPKSKKRGRITSSETARAIPPPPTYAPVPCHGPPPPSKRRYTGSSKFERPTQSSTAPVIGTAGFDFLRRIDVKEADAGSSSGTGNNTVKFAPTGVKAEAARTSNSMPLSTEGVNMKEMGKPKDPKLTETTTSVSFEVQKPDELPTGTILDTFFSLVSGQENVKEEARPEDSNNLLVTFAEGEKPAATASSSSSWTSAANATHHMQGAQCSAQNRGVYDCLIPTAGMAPLGSCPDPLPAGTMPLMAHAMTVPVPAFDYVSVHATRHTLPQPSQATVLLGSNLQAGGSSSQPKPGKKPSGGLQSSMWAS